MTPMSEMTLTSDAIGEATDKLLRAMEAFRHESPGELKAACEAYAEVVASVNDRLRAAHVLLRQGRTAEALHACEAEPHVLECANDLEPADQAIDAWRTTLEEVGIQCPELLLSDTAAELNAAYDVRHQLAHLMRTHRLLAIGRGSLEDRVATLRAMAHLNPENPVWVEDLVEYEQQCRTELEAELARLGRTDAAGITEAVVVRARKVVKELSDSRWQEPLPAQLVHKAEGILARLRSDLARQELETLADRLVSAHAVGDIDQAEALCERWEKCSKRARLEPDSPLSQETRACREWVRTAVAERNALAELRVAMDEVSRACSLPAAWTPWQSRPVREQLRAALHQMEARQADAAWSDEAVALSVAARQRLQSLDRVPMLFYSASGVVALCLVTAAALVGNRAWTSIHRAHVVATLRADIATLEKEEKFAEAKLAWQTACDRDGWLESHPLAEELAATFADWDADARDAIVRAGKALQDCRQELTDTVPRHLEELARARTSAGDIPRAAFDASSSIAAKVTWIRGRIEDAREELDAAEKRGTTEATGGLEDEARKLLDQVADVEKDTRAKAREVRDARERSLQREVDQLKGLKDTELAERREAIEDLRKRIGDVERFADPKLEGLRGELAGLDDRIRGVVGRREVRERLGAAAEQGHEEFLEALGEEKPRLSEAEIKGVGEVEAAKPCTDAALAWSEVGAAWLPGLRGAAADLKRLHDALVKARALELRPSSDEATEQRLELVLAVLEEPDRDGGKALQTLRDYLANPVMQDDVLLVAREDGNYYTRKAEKEDGGYFYGDNLIDPRNRKLPSLVEAAACKAPHADWAAALRADSAAIRDGKLGPEDGIVKMIDSCGSPAAEAVDPLLVCRILKLLVDAAGTKAMLADVERIGTLGERVGAAVGAEPEWIDPNKRRKALETPARNAVARSDIEQAVADARDSVKEVAARPAFCRALTFAGWTERHGDEITLHMRRKVRSGGAGAVYAIVPEGDASWKFVEVARLADGAAEVTNAAPLVFGRPLFIEVADRKTAARPEADDVAR